MPLGVEPFLDFLIICSQARGNDKSNPIIFFLPELKRDEESLFIFWGVLFNADVP